MEISQIPLGAQDLDRAVSWWAEHLSATSLATFSAPGLAFVGVGATRVMFERGGSPGRCYVQVEDAASMVEELRERGVVVSSEVGIIFDDETGIFGNPGVERLGMVVDSEGNQIGLMSRHAGTTDEATR